MNNMKELDKATLDILIKSGVLKAEDLERLTNKKTTSTNINVRESIRDFFEYMKKDYSENTATGYKTNVESFMSHILGVDKINEIKDTTILPEIITDSVERWFTYLMANGYEPASVRRFKHSIKKYFDFVFELGYNAPRLGNIEMPEQEEVEIEAMLDEEVKDMASYASSLRDKTIILFLYEAGMRRQELIDCKKEHIDWTKGFVKIFNNMKFDRMGYLSDEMLSLLKQHIEQWGAEVEDINDKRLARSKAKNEIYKELKVSEYLFQTARSEQMSYSTIFKVIKDTAFEYFLNVANKDGMIEGEAKAYADGRSSRVNTDTLRHSKRTYLFSTGKTVEQVQVIMGDENKWLCRRYLAVAQKLYPEKFRG